MTTPFRFGELCPLPARAARRDSFSTTDKSVVIEPEVTSRFETLLELHDAAVYRGLPHLADYYADRIIDAMVGR